MQANPSRRDKNSPDDSLVVQLAKLRGVDSQQFVQDLLRVLP